MLPAEVNWYDEGSNSGELRRVIKALSVIFADGNVDIEAIDANIVMELNDEELDAAFSSSIMLETFYANVNDLMAGSLNGVLYIKTGTVKDKEEAINFVNSIKVVLDATDSDLNSMDGSSFDINVFMSFNDQQIDTFTRSNIVRYSAAKQVLGIISGDTAALRNYIVLNGKNDEEKTLEVEADLANLIRAIRDLDQNGIPYEQFSFVAFETAINSAASNLGSSATLKEIDDAKNAKADSIAESLLKSQIIVQSLNTMINSILSDTLSSGYMALVNTDLTEAQWRGEGEDIGELKRIMRLVSSINSFNSGADNSMISDPNELVIPLKKVNHSLVLHGLLPRFVETATVNIDSWRRTDADGRKVLPSTVDEWDVEIETLANLIVEVQDIDLANINVTGDDAIDPDKLGAILYLINDSVMIDIEKVIEPLEEGVKAVFELENVEMGTVTASAGETLHDAWDVEIGKIVEIVRKLQDIDELTITGTNGINNAEKIGAFLDAASESQILSPAVDSVITSIVGPFRSIPQVESIISGEGTYTEKLVSIATFLSTIL